MENIERAFPYHFQGKKDRIRLPNSILCAKMEK
jgi:hypothetical protein